jgi:hypothetical protein
MWNKQLSWICSPRTKALLDQKNNWKVNELIQAHTLGKQVFFTEPIDKIKIERIVLK